MATVQVILKEKITGLGAEADVVKVRRGYARNFLVPSGRAYEATSGNLRHIEHLKSVRVQREAEELATAEKLANRLKKLKLKLTLATGQGGKAFGSITTMDLAEAIKKDSGIELDRHAIDLEKPIKNTGSFDVPIRVHADVQCTVKVTVEAEKPADAADDQASAA